MNEQPEALRLASGIVADAGGAIILADQVAAELRRLADVEAERDQLLASDEAHRAALGAIYTALQPSSPDRDTWPAGIAAMRIALATATHERDAAISAQARLTADRDSWRQKARDRIDDVFPDSGIVEHGPALEQPGATNA